MSLDMVIVSRRTEVDRNKGQAWGLKTIAGFHTHGTPPVAQGDK